MTMSVRSSSITSTPICSPVMEGVEVIRQTANAAATTSARTSTPRNTARDLPMSVEPRGRSASYLPGGGVGGGDPASDLGSFMPTRVSGVAVGGGPGARDGGATIEWWADADARPLVASVAPASNRIDFQERQV